MKARELHRRAMNEEITRFLEMDLKKAEAAHRKAEGEEFVRLFEEDRRKAEEVHRRAMVHGTRGEAARRRYLSMDSKQESMERERQERVRLEEERREREAAELNVIMRLCL